MTHTIAAEAHHFSHLVAAEVRARLARSGCGVVDAAQAIGISSEDLTASLSGERRLLLDELGDLADFLGTSCCKIVTEALALDL